MFTALLTFLGSAAVRLALGHIFDFITKWQDNRNELARLKLQGDLDDAQHKRTQDTLRLQAELGVKVIEAQTQAHGQQADDDAFVEGVRNTGKATGVAWVDVWNGIIRPALATVCIGLWLMSLNSRHWVLDDWDRALMSLALGIFVGGRIHATGR